MCFFNVTLRVLFFFLQALINQELQLKLIEYKVNLAADFMEKTNSLQSYYQNVHIEIHIWHVYVNFKMLKRR